MYVFSIIIDAAIFINILKPFDQQFESDSSSGCILFLYSIILSRTIERLVGKVGENETECLFGD